MQGRRVNISPHLYVPGDYGIWEGIWYGCPKENTLGCFGDGSGIHGHKVIEHHDGSITVSPSIKITAREMVYHGYLENGVWRDSP